MDIIYCFGDSFSYRTPVRDYEQFPIEETQKNAQAKPKHQQNQKKESRREPHGRCELCKEKAKEQRKRPLKSEIKRCANRTESICEEAEES